MSLVLKLRTPCNCACHSKSNEVDSCGSLILPRIGLHLSQFYHPKSFANFQRGVTLLAILFFGACIYHLSCTTYYMLHQLKA